jgi:hypothetical protein
LVFLDCVFKTLGRNVALAANGLGLLDLLQSWSSVSHWEEKLWILIEASGLV